MVPEQDSIINLWYGNQKTVLPVAMEIIDECEKLIQRIATPGICAINCEEYEFIGFVQGRKAVGFVSMYFDSNTAREEITKKVNQTQYENTMLYLYIVAVPQPHQKRHLLFWILRNGLIMKRMRMGRKEQRVLLNLMKIWMG